uniref:Uncharacterized protein n=1 Tax=Anguilla anguilla TaxID=7936 RepID=A0A0E9XH23_ANGAN
MWYEVVHINLHEQCYSLECFKSGIENNHVYIFNLYTSRSSTLHVTVPLQLYVNLYFM